MQINTHIQTGLLHSEKYAW